MKFKITVTLVAILTLIPLLSSAAPDISCGSALLLDSETGIVLYEKIADEKMYPASTTKIMTAILAVENGKMDDVLTASFEAINTISYDSSKVCLSEGESMTLRDLFYSLIVASANDAANVIAEYISGSTVEFAKLMNTRAAELGAMNTNFVNAHGLHDDKHYTTAHDLGKIAQYAMSLPMIVDAVSSREYHIPPTNKCSEERVLHSTNHLINPASPYYYTYATGLKTGYTSRAGSCLVSSASKGTSSFISVVLCGQSQDGRNMSFIDSRELLKYGFENFKPQTVISAGDIISDLPIKNAKGAKAVILEAAKSKSVILPEGASIDNLEKVEYIRETVVAPIKKGEMLGKMEYWLNGDKLCEVDMVSVRDYQKIPFAFILTPLHLIFTSLWFYILLLAVLAFYLVCIARRRPQRRAPVTQFRRR